MNTTQPSQPVASQPALSAGSALTQVSGVLAAIVILILACAWLAKRLGLAGKRSSGSGLTLSASCQLGPRERVVVVDVEDARLVLGVTAQQITHLHTLPPAPAATDSDPQPRQADFRQIMQSLLKRTGKPQ